MQTYYNKEEFAGVVVNKIAESVFNHKADMAQELSAVYFDKSPDIEYAIRGKAFLKTSYNDNGYFIKFPKE